MKSSLFLEELLALFYSQFAVYMNLNYIQVIGTLYILCSFLYTVDMYAYDDGAAP